MAVGRSATAEGGAMAAGSATAVRSATVVRSMTVVSTMCGDENWQQYRLQVVMAWEKIRGAVLGIFCTGCG